MNKGSRIALIVIGSIASLLATALVAGGALALWGDSQKGSDGYLTTDTHRFEASGRALATENLDVDLGDADWLAQTDDLGKVKVTAESRDGKPVFVDIEASPFSADYTRHSGQRHPVSPEHAGIWAASSYGNGSRSFEWKVDDGDYSVVVMNADGSLGVDADIKAGADVPFLDELGWSAIGSGAFALVIGIGLIALGVRRPKAVAA
jgi:hypothetical protein